MIVQAAFADCGYVQVGIVGPISPFLTSGVTI